MAYNDQGDVDNEFLNGDMDDDFEESLDEISDDGNNIPTEGHNSADVSLDDNDENHQIDVELFFEACINNEEEEVKYFINKGHDVNARNGNGRIGLSKNTALIYACLNNNVTITEMLLKANANVNARNSAGLTALYISSYKGFTNIVKLLTEYGAVVENCGPSIEDAAIVVACQSNFLEIVEILLKSYRNEAVKLREINLALILCFSLRNFKLINLLTAAGADIISLIPILIDEDCENIVTNLIESGISIETRTYNGFTLLMEAVRLNRKKMVKLIIKLGANVNALSSEGTLTPLAVACHYGNIKIIKMLLKAKPLLDIPEFTPLMTSIQKGHLEIVMHLIEAGANLNKKTDSGYSAFTIACECGHETLVVMLYEKNKSCLEEHCANGLTPLMRACERGRINIIEILMNFGADINYTIGDNSPLSCACEAGKLETMNFLIAKGVKMYHKLTKTGTPLLIKATMSGNVDVVRLLLDYIGDSESSKFDVNEMDYDNNDTALTVACHKGYGEIVKLLLLYGANIHHRTKNGHTALDIVTIAKNRQIKQILTQHIASKASE